MTWNFWFGDRFSADCERLMSALQRALEEANAAERERERERLEAEQREKKRLLVGKWASYHKVANAWDMGPKNWERCLYDLGYPGGVQHELVYESDGKLRYQ
jgi:hypothetical protein